MTPRPVKQEILLLTDIARAFRPRTLRKELALSTTVLSTAALATTVWLRLFGSRHIAISAVEICATVGLIGGLTQSVALVGLASIFSLGLIFAGMLKISPILHAVMILPKR
jgi:hypothetical protein